MREKTYTTFDISEMLDVYSSTVARWIDNGSLKAYVTPGGHRRVRKRDLLNFLQLHNMPLPLNLRKEKTRILVVEDEKVLLGNIEKFFKKNNEYEVFTATDGFKAGQSVIDNEPDIVILDIMLPGVDGFDICRSIKERNSKIKVLIMSGYNIDEFRDEIKQCGAGGFIAKPFELEELSRAIKKLLK